ncbi:MAG: hypothetical protein U9N55_08415, partial [candidate division Zixibacteria bacterium]|nr:hypothetical protein [candidate division Zixibacteria bacterium]
MSNKYRISLLACLLSITAAFLLIVAVQCTNKSVNTTNTPSVNLSFKLSSPELSQMIASLRIVISADDMMTIDDTVEVHEDQGYVFSDTLEIPVGLNRLFEVEALDAAGNVLYQGEEMDSVSSEVTITVQVTLEPMVSLLKLQPRFVEVDEGKSFTFDTRIFNVKNLYDLTFRVYYDSTLLRFDSVMRSSDNNSEEINFSYDTIKSEPSYVKISMSHTDGTTLLVDTAGNATLAGFRFVARGIESAIDTTYLGIEYKAMSALSDDTLEIYEPFIFDSCLVQINEDTSFVFGTVVIDQSPDELNAPWSLSGPDSYSTSGTGDNTLTELTPGEYTVTWGDVESWITPTNSSQTLSANDTITFSGTYTYDVELPEVTTNSVTNITQTTATCGGNVTSDGGATVTACGVCWSTNPNPTVSESKTIDGSGLGVYQSSITGLTPGVDYHVRAYATNSDTTGYGDDEHFTTDNPDN